MKLLTHNMLTSKCLKNVVTGYPLAIQATSVKVCEVDFNREFVSRIIPKLDYSVLYNAAQSVGHLGELPTQLIDDYENNEDFLKKVHHVLLEVDVVNGDLICPETGRKFPISDGIPNMLLNEDEVKTWGKGFLFRSCKVEGAFMLLFHTAPEFENLLQAHDPRKGKSGLKKRRRRRWL